MVRQHECNSPSAAASDHLQRNTLALAYVGPGRHKYYGREAISWSELNTISYGLHSASGVLEINKERRRSGAELYEDPNIPTMGSPWPYRHENVAPATNLANRSALIHLNKDAAGTNSRGGHEWNRRRLYRARGSLDGFYVATRVPGPMFRVRPS